MNTLSKIYNRKNGWFVLFFNSRDREFKLYSDLLKNFSKNTKDIFTSGVVNCKSDEEICDEFSIKNTPKILYFPDDGSEYQIYNGGKNWKEMFKFGSNQMQNFVKVINNENYNDFLKWHCNQFHVILFTSKKNTPPLFKLISKIFLGKLTFGEIKQSEKELCKIFEIKKFPSLIVLTDEEEYKYEMFDNKMDKIHIEKFLNKYTKKKKEINKVLKIRELNLNLYNKNFCNNKDGKNTCFIYFSQGSKLTYNEKKLLENIGNKYLNDKIIVLYLNPKNYPNFWKSFDEEDKNCKAVIIKGKRNKYYPINKEKFNEKELINILDNIISGGGDNKKLIKPLNLNKNDYGDL
jgi:DnaJ family protein C protein 16